MIDAVVGSVIMVVATTSLVLAIEVSEKAFRQSGYQPLSPREVSLVNNVHRLHANTGFPDAKTFEDENSSLFSDRNSSFFED